MPHILTAWTERALAESNLRILDAYDRLAVQHGIIAKLQTEGLSTKLALELLSVLQDSLLILEDHREMLIRQSQ